MSATGPAAATLANTCGVLVHAMPERDPDLARAIGALPGAEVHAGPAPGRLLVVVEDVGESRAFDTIAAINRLPGVIAASLVYHHFEPLDVDDREAPVADIAP
ncbi:MAG: chaperone NapD [Burkholderiaceae bacterium]|nr:chaperone NapD [Burkholderiaceae bacterium]